MEQRTVGFEADYERLVVTVNSSGVRTESRELFRLYRDGRGRTRMEGTTLADGATTIRFAFLTDAEARRAVVLDLATGKRLSQRSSRQGGLGTSVRRWPETELGSSSGSSTQAGGETQSVEDLGEAEIEGLAAGGRRITTPSSTVEVWTARAIDQPPLLIRKNEPSREEIERLFNIRIKEPDPDLFEPLEAP